MQPFVVILLSLVLQVVAFPAGITDVGYSTSTNLSEYGQPITSPNGTIIFRNTTVGDERYNENWQYEGTDECKWASKYMPYVSSECTEYCEADTYNWGYRFHRLRYHIKLSGNGQDPATWCDNFKARMMYNCAVGQPDFFNCNSGRAPELLVLRTWVFDGSNGQIVQKTGINLRFDFSPWWETRDAEHDCVKSAIREATCAGAIFRNGLRCMPTMYVAPSGAPEFDESFVQPTRCMYNSEVPSEAT
ncbi:hypothetical protein F4781DRAFT_322904 [Annulohypoxylon bovei var. microspora]|nr:hypothetical protein F4781DRAFT_322904 [Annulohypoxylon bovei var. microspora]